MSTYTQNLNLFKYDVVADRKAPYNIIECLNNNWDKLDVAYGDLTTSLNNAVSTMRLDLNRTKQEVQTQLEETEEEVRDCLKCTYTNGYIKFNNNICIQWGSRSGFGYKNTQWIELPISYLNNYSVGGSASYHQSAGDKGSSWAAYNLNLTGFNLRGGFEQYGGNTIWWITSGY